MNVELVVAGTIAYVMFQRVQPTLKGTAGFHAAQLDYPFEQFVNHVEREAAERAWDE